MRRHKYKHGMFLSLEGSEGAGKTTMLGVMEEWFKEHGRAVIRVREPGGTPMGERLRTVFLEGRNDNTGNVMSDILILVAAKFALYHDVILPALANGKVVITDRWTDTLYAYQGSGFGAKNSTIDAVLKSVKMDVDPDLTIHLDLPVSVGKARIKDRADNNALDEYPDEFFDRVRKGYHKRARNCEHIVQVDADRPVELVRLQVRNVLNERLGSKT
jgi:dTMP kinase